MRGCPAMGVIACDMSVALCGQHCCAGELWRGDGAAPRAAPGVLLYTLQRVNMLAFMLLCVVGGCM